MSSVNNRIVVTGCEFSQNAGMPLIPKDVKARTLAIREALGKEPQELSLELKLAKNAWFQYENVEYKRLITLRAAVRLRDAYKVSLDWLFFGDQLSSLPESITYELRKRGFR